MKARNLENELPVYNEPVMLVVKFPHGIQNVEAKRTHTDIEGEHYQYTDDGEELDVEILGWFPIITEIDIVFPTEG